MEAACTLRYIFLDDRAGGYRRPVRLAPEHRAAPSSRAAAAVRASGPRTFRSAACTLRYIFLDDRAGGCRCPVRLAREHRAAPSPRAAAAIGAYGQRTVRGPGDLVVWRPGPGLPASPADRGKIGTRPRARPARQAEGVGFEPTVTLPPQWFSRPVRTFQLIPSRSTGFRFAQDRKSVV